MIMMDKVFEMVMIFLFALCIYQIAKMGDDDE